MNAQAADPTDGIRHSLGNLKKQGSPAARRGAPKPPPTNEPAIPEPAPPTPPIEPATPQASPDSDPTEDLTNTIASPGDNKPQPETEASPVSSKKKRPPKRTPKSGPKKKTNRRFKISATDHAAFDTWRKDAGHSVNTAVQLAFAKHNKDLTKDSTAGDEQLLLQAGLDVPPRRAAADETRIPIVFTPSENATQVISERANELGLSMAETLRRCIAAEVNHLQ